MLPFGVERKTGWERQRKRVAKIHQRIQDRRKDFIEKLTTRLAHDFDVIVDENLSVKNMRRCGAMWVGKSIFPVSRRYGDVQPGASPRGPESHSVQPALRPGPRGSPPF